MNKFNLTKLSKYGLLAEITHTSAGHPVIQLNFPANLEIGPKAHEGPPHFFESDKFSAATSHISDGDRREFFESDESCTCAVRVLNALAKQGQAAAAAAADRTLSADGKLARRVDALATSLTIIGAQYASLLSIEAKLERQYAQLYAAPVADVVDALGDRELREWFSKLGRPEQMSRVVSEVADPRLLVALKRSLVPLDSAIEEQVRNRWVNEIALAKPEQAATLKIAQDNNSWATRFTRFIASLASSPSLSGTNGAVDRFACYRILKPTGGAAVLEFKDQEIEMYERRLLEAAA